LLSVNGRENAVVAIVFGAWLRRTEYTADRFGLLCCGSLEAGNRAITIATFHHFGRDVDIAAFAAQRAVFGSDSILNMGEWLSSVPYATNRLQRLRQFRESALYAYWEEDLIKHPLVFQAFTPVPREGRVARADCAGFGRRVAALLIDLIVIASIFSLTPEASRATGSTTLKKNVVVMDNATLQKVAQDEKGGIKMARGGAARDRLWRFLGVFHTGATWTVIPFGGLPQEFMIYSFILVALSGQTLGMMILECKVTTTRFHRPPIWLALWRALVSPLGIFTFILGPIARIGLHDRLSGARVVRLERTFERAPAAT